MAKYRVAIIIPVYNQWDLTRQCLQSLQEHTDANDVQVIVVDNGSTDETREACPSLGHNLFGPRFDFIRLETNIHFGPGCNLGADRADAQFLFFLNNDTLLTPGWLSPLLQAFALRPNLGAVGPLLLYPETNRVQHLGVIFTPTRQVNHLYHYFPHDHPVVSKYRELQAITGAALLIPAQLFQQVGGFWPEYRNGCEDLDLCAQVRRQGKTLICEPSSQIYHLTSQTQGRFDHGPHNFALLHQRCAQDFSPDKHIWAAKDGYTLRLTYDLVADIVLERPEQKTADLGLKELWAEVLAEPLWEQGYTLLTNELIQAKIWDEAVEIVTLQMQFFSSEESLWNLAKIATKTQNKELMTQCQAMRTALDQAYAQHDIYRKFQSIRHWATTAQDAILHAACQKWEKKYIKG